MVRAGDDPAQWTRRYDSCRLLFHTAVSSWNSRIHEWHAGTSQHLQLRIIGLDRVYVHRILLTTCFALTKATLLFCRDLLLGFHNLRRSSSREKKIRCHTQVVGQIQRTPEAVVARAVVAGTDDDRTGITVADGIYLIYTICGSNKFRW